jgi:hypothetical protein
MSPGATFRGSPLVALAAGGLDTARAVAAELEEVAGVYGSAALAAAAACARGALLLADGDAHAAAPVLHDGIRLWQDASAPYEVARTRLLLADALREVGNTSRAQVELRAACSAFESLGARLDAERAARLREELAPIAREP